MLSADLKYRLAGGLMGSGILRAGFVTEDVVIDRVGERGDNLCRGARIVVDLNDRRIGALEAGGNTGRDDRVAVF